MCHDFALLLHRENIHINTWKWRIIAKSHDIFYCYVWTTAVSTKEHSYGLGLQFLEIDVMPSGFFVMILKLLNEIDKELCLVKLLYSSVMYISKRFCYSCEDRFFLIIRNVDICVLGISLCLWYSSCIPGQRDIADLLVMLMQLWHKSLQCVNPLLWGWVLGLVFGSANKH